MKQPAAIRASLDADMYPPFDGFPAEGLSFLQRLRKNNNREWFNGHKGEFEEFVKLPMLSLITSLQQPMLAVAPEVSVDTKKSMFRIYRDTRFSNDKTPYKTHVAAVFHPKGHWEASAGYYLHIEPKRIYVGGGVYRPDSAQLKAIRMAIAQKEKEFLEIVENRSFLKKFGGLEEEKLQRAPLGYSPDHPMIEWLKQKSFYAGVEWTVAECRNEKFVGKVTGVYKDLLPLIRFLNRALIRSSEK